MDMVWVGADSQRVEEEGGQVGGAMGWWWASWDGILALGGRGC